MASVDQGASARRGISTPFNTATVVDQPTKDPVVYFKLLGWNGSTPVRWISRSYDTGKDGLTNITIEDEWEVLE